MRRVYLALLHLYPWDYRARFTSEMLNAFARACEQRRGRGRIAFFAGELFGLVTGAAAEWMAKLTTDAAARARVLPDLRMMRPVGVPKEVFFAAPGGNHGRT